MAGNLPLIVILGPTAVGKTHLAIRLAQALNGEIISADSRQIYRYMNIGTAKPTSDEQQTATHHLIDIVDPDKKLSLAQYQRRAYASIDVVHERGQLPLLVGGTGQYITAVIEGWSIPEVPPNDELRAELEAYADEHGTNALHNRLEQRDPDAAEKIHPNNVRRVVRALEVCIETDTPITELQRKRPPPYAIRQYGLHMDRDTLYNRADKRVDVMLEAGLMQEVKWLLDNGYPANLPAMSGIGYRQFAEHIQDNMPLSDAIETTKNATHDFIRRQYTWFRGHDDGIIWLDAASLNAEDVISEIQQWLEEQT